MKMNSKTQTQVDVFSNNYLGNLRTTFNLAFGVLCFPDVGMLISIGYHSSPSVIKLHTNQYNNVATMCKDLYEKNRILFRKSTRCCRQMTLIKEASIYKSIMASFTEVSEKFKTWVGDVFVSIRQNGGYIYGQENLTPDKLGSLLTEITTLRKKFTMLIKADIKHLFARCHRLSKEKAVAVEENGVLKKNLRYMKEDSNYLYKIYKYLISDYKDLEFKYSSLVNSKQQYNIMKCLFPEATNVP